MTDAEWLRERPEMTAPTTRAELEQFLADLIRPIEDGEEGWIDAAERILAALDTFAVVCPRYPTPHIEHEFMRAGGKQETDPGLSEFFAWYGDFGNFAAAWNYAVAASPFAPKEPIDG